MTAPSPTLREQIEQLDQLHRDGLISADLHQRTRQQLELALVAQVVGAPAASAASAPPAAAAAVPATAPRAHTAWRTRAGMAAFVLLLGGAGYAWKGQPGALSGPGGAGGWAAPAPAEAAASAPHALGNDQMAAMVQGLADRLKAQPNDAPGWAMLARSYATMERHDQALNAYAKAVELAPQDAALMADYADSLAVQQGRKLSGTPMNWVRRALKADPAQPKALLLAGTEAFQRQAYPEAIGHWEKVVQGGQASPGLLAQAQAGLADARQAAGLPPAEAAPIAASPSPAAPGGAQVSGRVTLSPALAAQAKPDDTVFVVARPAQGPRMPLAVLRRQVKDLPLDFVLDDSLAMSPAARLSGASTVVVTARISRSGQAMPQPGDLEGVSPAVPVGRSGLALEIRDAVK